MSLKQAEFWLRALVLALVAIAGGCAPVANGEPCGDGYCETALVCRPDGRGVPTCLAPAKPSDEEAFCDTDSDCAPKASCRLGVCKADKGQICGADRECASGVCVPLGDGKVCGGAVGSGCAPCDGPADCSSGLCQGGVCRVPVGGASDASACCADGAESEGGECLSTLGSPCKGDSDCVSSAWCDSAVCAPQRTEPGPCTSERSCAPSLTCMDGACRVADGGVCNADHDCQSLACIGGTCADKATACGACDSVTDCLSGTCSIGLCGVEASQPCSATACCPEGLFCRAVGAGDKTCEPPAFIAGSPCVSSVECQSPLSCIDGACFVPLGGACPPGGDALCASGTFCIGGACVPPGTSVGAPCGKPEHCAVPLSCADGECRLPVGSACSGQGAECIPGAVCVSGACIPQPLGGTSCFEVKGKTICVPIDDPAIGADTGLAGMIPAPPGGLPVSAALDRNGFVVGDQGQCGSCVAFATRSAMGLRAIGQQGQFDNFSAAHIWHIAGYGSEDCDVGSYIAKVFDSNIQQHEHVVPTSVWPYNAYAPKTSLDSVPASALLELDGLAYITTSAYVEPHSLDDIKAAIAMGWPVVIGVRFFLASGWNSDDGVIDVPPPGSPADGYHAVAIWSYDDLTSRFGFVNSWGTSFGVSGFGSMTYDFVQQYSTGGRAIPGLSYSDCVGGLCGSCGDQVCSAAETQASCCSDCGCSGGMLCQGGACSCPSGLVACGGQCKTLAADPDNCGACGHACGAGQVCLAGQCKLSCGALTNCGGSCIDLATNAASCGECDHACDAGKSCIGGACACVPTSPPTEVCDGLDNDCDGLVDEDPACVVCVDLDDVSVSQLANTMGDNEFDGHGPDVDVTVSFTRTSGSVTATTCVVMKETEADWTTGVRCVDQTKYVVNTSLASDPLFELRYVDTDHDWDNAIAESYSLLDNGTVTGVTCIGDTSGGDVCSDAGPPSCSGCVLSLGCVNVRVPPP